VLYLLSALGGSALYYLLAPFNEFGLGASGAIFGLFGAYFVVARRLRADTRAIIFLIVLNLGISFAVPDIAWQAHVGGLLTGGLLTAAYAYAPRNRRALVQAGATVAMVVVLVIIVVTRNHQLLSGSG
jgi:membrane associated rhomboid family serine protease